MHGANIILKKISSKTLKSSDIFIFLKQLEEDIRQGKANASRDDIQWFQIYGFLLKKLETAIAGNPSDMRASDWRTWVDDFGKLNYVVAEMEENNIVTAVSWYIPDIAVFDIVNRNNYRDYVYCRVSNHLEKIYLPED
ncbi:conserved hypothetical protein [Methanosalsum zhilinae DSM 4017]|uniref:Uncharacterized protein n=1 Tax=Methanosalsum zhilinae (strain DSM 4017 / NBRC 107636 / OCM 62 / WeN5) TaxID=679901 RepID=F7XN83_METZD|nr:hypothetical protein [Methanosalsum zhilinae]AEH60040.1 conserved hypothetical protein [Methanosalsum zhilinae DSM 4017]